MTKFIIVKSRRPGIKNKFMIFKNGKIIGRVAQISLDLSAAPFRRKTTSRKIKR